VYRFEPSTGVVQVVADGFVKINGLEFSPDYKTLYVSDTGAQEADLDLSGPASIYAYDIVDSKRVDNKRFFAYADSGIPDGLEGINALGREVCKDFGVDSDPRCNKTAYQG
jgi:gluconolactonase